MKKFLFTFTLLLPFILAQAQSVVLNTLYSFSGSDGSYPVAGLVQGTDGCFYGTTSKGGASGYGTIFKMTPWGSLTTLYSFTNGIDGKTPGSMLVWGKDGDLYGTSGGFNTSGTDTNSACFKISPAGGFTTLATIGNSPNGLILGSDGNYYGTTSYGGSGNNGTIFKMTPSGVATTIAAFDGTNGSSPSAGLVEGNDGTFYGTTYSGGDSTYGTIFKVTTNGVVTRLYSFDGGFKGANPFANLAQGHDGSFYGTTTRGDDGTVFKFTPSGIVTFLHQFYAYDDGLLPFGGLTQASDGKFYGTTLLGGIHGSGIIYQVSSSIVSGTNSVAFRTLAPLNSNSDPYSGVTQGSDGIFYGVTYGGGGGGGGTGHGTFFRLVVPLTPILQPVIRSSNTVAVTWSAVSSLNYQVQYRTNLTQTNWVNLGGIIQATNGAMTATDSGVTDSERYYRVVLGP